jgi:hypothetical protein
MRNLNTNHSTFCLVVVEAFLLIRLVVNAKNLLCVAPQPHLKTSTFGKIKATISPYGADFVAGELRLAPIIEKNA